MQAVLQAAYLRQLLGVPPAGSRHPAPADGSGSGAVDAQRAVRESSQKARSSLKPFISEVRCCRCAATFAFVLLSCRLPAHSVWRCGLCSTDLYCGLSLLQQRAERRAPGRLPTCLQLREQGWQLAPFMLSSTEKQRYLQL